MIAPPSTDMGVIPKSDCKSVNVPLATSDAPSCSNLTGTSSVLDTPCRVTVSSTALLSGVLRCACSSTRG
ncbi:hypothetical protein LP420_36890 [Massilia sp. B-10]|nr:hypothetical protein LP420_36890 [Massilia sp. B-10]UUZ53953.1 hypothetical protein LP419_36310 [Massilia sp. H-1]